MILVMSVQSLASVKTHFSSIIDEVSTTHARVTVTRNGSPVAVILAVEDYESLIETVTLLSDPAAMDEIRQARTDVAQGLVHGEADVRQALASRRG